MSEITASKPLTLDSGPQLLIDDYLVDDIWMIRRSPELPVKSLDNPIFEISAPFEDASYGVSNVIYDKEENIFRMWYSVSTQNTSSGSQPPVSSKAYAVSEDGLHWETPSLGLIEYNGSRDNNLCVELDQGSGSVLLDPHDPDPGRRYKMLHKRPWKQGMEGRVTLSFSPDGIHWTPYFKDWRKSVRPRSNDGVNITLYDPKLGKYVLFCRPNVLAAGQDLDPREVGFPPGWVREEDFADPAAEANIEKEVGDGGRKKPQKELGFPTEDDFVLHREAEDYMHRYLKVPQYVHTQALRLYKYAGGCNRRVARAESDDFINWTIPEVVIRPDELDPPRLYNLNGVGIYNGLYIGALQLYHSWGFRGMPGCPQESETLDLQLTFSRDGKTWERLANRPTFLPRGLIGAFDGGNIFTASPVLVECGDEIRIYYTGQQHAHLVPGGKCGIGVARLPKERLVARVAGDELGVMITKPFVLEGDRLEINADARRGLMKVEVADVMGVGIPGFTVDEAGEIREDGFRLPVEWKNRGSVEELRGKTVRLRFYLLHTRLYSFCLSE